MAAFRLSLIHYICIAALVAILIAVLMVPIRNLTAPSVVRDITIRTNTSIIADIIVVRLDKYLVVDHGSVGPNKDNIVLRLFSGDSTAEYDKCIFVFIEYDGNEITCISKTGLEIDHDNRVLDMPQ